MNDWKPIETVPGGVDVLLFNRDDGRMFVGRENPKVLHSWNGVATHWMPLPDMPKEQPAPDLLEALREFVEVGAEVWGSDVRWVKRGAEAIKKAEGGE